MAHNVSLLIPATVGVYAHPEVFLQPPTSRRQTIALHPPRDQDTFTLTALTPFSIAARATLAASAGAKAPMEKRNRISGGRRGPPKSFGIPALLNFLPCEVE